MARGLLRDRRWTVSGRLKIFPKSSERQDRMSYKRISQAGLEDLPGFFVTAQLHVEHGFG
jgi:hypothetical protein